MAQGKRLRYYAVCLFCLFVCCWCIVSIALGGVQFRVEILKGVIYFSVIYSHLSSFVVDTFYELFSPLSFQLARQQLSAFLTMFIVITPGF